MVTNALTQCIKVTL